MSFHFPTAVGYPVVKSAFLCYLILKFPLAFPLSFLLLRFNACGLLYVFIFWAYKQAIGIMYALAPCNISWRMCFDPA